ncbi:DUF6263 family protein [Pedobacter rhizosphaerae]|uniref:YceI-like domain-containing protein n=1 Tax=Pedobacter rhizosphaerae TaxID=390241 RepID=A0A1H9VUS4_9SPHI|nr:DUF6263 family protein [Pedobacter rhizosphaerae]SES25033.1 hypothetical protein SAMN04488023_14923 [Pedobacter rhizosphaerae]
MKFIKVLALSLISISAFAQKSYVLKQNFPIGKKYDFSFVSDQIINQKIGEEKINSTQTIGTDYTFDVRNGENTDKNIEVIYGRIFMKSSAMGNGMSMDSEDQDTTKVNPFKGIKGATFNMVMAPDGTVKSLTGVDQMLNSMASKMSKDTAMVNNIKMQLSKQFNAASLTQTMETSLKIYPEKAIKIGESWVINSQSKLMMPIETSTKYTLKEVKDGIAYLKVSGSLTSKGSFETMGNKMETDLSGTNSGDAELDIKSGLILKSHIRTELIGKMKAMGQDIDFELQGINKVVGKEIAGARFN